jgi:hypothetical protein
VYATYFWRVPFNSAPDIAGRRRGTVYLITSRSRTGGQPSRMSFLDARIVLKRIHSVVDRRHSVHFD